MIRFVLNGRQHQLTRADVEKRTAKHQPESGQKFLVEIGDRSFPVKQAFEIAIGVRRSEFTSHTARRHLVALGFDVRGEVERRQPRLNSPRVRNVPGPKTEALDEDWHREGAVQALLVAWLAAEGWQILRVANTETKEQGVDVVASRGVETIGFEVKGFPGRTYADPKRKGEIKPTAPSTQAGHWYSQAVLAAMRLRGKQPDWRSAIALPDFRRYRNLYAETAGSLAAAGIEMFWVSQFGEVTVDRSQE